MYDATYHDLHNLNEPNRRRCHQESTRRDLSSEVSLRAISFNRNYRLDNQVRYDRYKVTYLLTPAVQSE